MAPRSTPPPKGAFYPSNDVGTYRDLLLFEERLKSNAANLQLRKSRYQLFLVQLILIIFFLLLEVFAHWSLLRIAYKLVLHRWLPDAKDVDIPLHPYIAHGLLFLSIATLGLFFASGMYSEKIAYANQYVPHANKALRSLNMYLNVRKPPLRSRFNPLTFFFPRATPPSPTSPLGSKIKPQAGTSNTPVAISPIPPSQNPRGELIFSSRVDRSFRDSYEKFRAAFERKREEKLGLQKAWIRQWLGRYVPWPWTSQIAVVPPADSPSRPPSVMRTHNRLVSGSRSGTPPTDTERVRRSGTASLGRKSRTHSSITIPKDPVLVL